MEKKLLIAMALGVLIILFYPYYIGKLYPPKDIPETAQKQAEPLKSETAVIPQETPDKKTAGEIIPLEETITVVETQNLHLKFSDTGASIKEVTVRGLSKDKEFESLALAEIKSGDPGILSFPGALESVPFAVTPGENFITYHKSIDGLELEKKFTWKDDSYYINLQVSFRNSTDKDQLYGYKIIGAESIASSSEEETRSILSIIKTSEKVHYLNAGKLSKGEKRFTETHWVALKNKYLIMILKPEEPASYAFAWQQDKRIPACGLGHDPFIIKPGSTLTHNYLLYLGPKDVQLLKQHNLEESASYGKLNFLCQFLLNVLNILFNIFKNYGVAIIMLTTLVNVVLYPLTYKNYKSMRDMQLKTQELQPKLKKLQEELKNNPQRLNKETMELYKKHHINPLSMGGCIIPLLFQMPIYFALYRILMETISLRGANFLWIKDLAQPDCTFHLKFAIPFLGEYLNILPIITAVIMYFQQKFTTQTAGLTPEQKSQQKIMAIFMPLFLGFVFYQFPSGFVLYFMTSSVMTGLIQYYITKQHKEVKPA